MRTNPETFQNTHSFFTWDHQRLDAQLTEVARLVDTGELERARRLGGHYGRGMRRHLRLEEEVLYFMQAFERTGVTRAPVSFLDEHAQILKMVDDLEAALVAGDAARFREAHGRLIAFLPGHMDREERAFYPFVDALLGEHEAERIVTRLRDE